jgi:predicted lipid-binding transport protein (Tim44 family)
MRRQVVALLGAVFRRRSVEPPAPRTVIEHSPVPDEAPERGPARDEPMTDLEQGLRDIRATDRGFDPGRFVGYVTMTFRDAHAAGMSRDFRSLHDRATLEMHARLEARRERLQRAGTVKHADEIEIRATVTEAWQEHGQDYVRVLIDGSMIEFTLDEVSGRLVDGSRNVPRDIAERWTFTRRAGLNFWMLSAIEDVARVD